MIACMLFVQVCICLEIFNLVSFSGYKIELDLVVWPGNMTAHINKVCIRWCEQDTNCTIILIRVQVVIILKVCMHVATHCYDTCNSKNIVCLAIYLKSVFVVSLSYFHYLDIYESYTQLE